MNFYKINPIYSLILKKDNYLICIKKNKILKYKVREEELDSVISILKSEYFEAQDTKIFKKLYKNKILIKCVDFSFSRNTSSYLDAYTGSNNVIEKLQGKKVFIIGLGGIGCEVITHLSSNGVNNFTILDFDKVEDTNLNRQYLYSVNDIFKA